MYPRWVCVTVYFLCSVQEINETISSLRSRAPYICPPAARPRMSDLSTVTSDLDVKSREAGLRGEAPEIVVAFLRILTSGPRTMPQRWRWTKPDVCNQTKTTHLNYIQFLTGSNSWNTPSLNSLRVTRPFLLIFGEYISSLWDWMKQKKKHDEE